MSRTVVLVVVLAALLLAAAPAAAHQDTVAYSRVVIRADGNVEYALKIPVEDLAEALGRQGHTALNAPEVRRAEELLFRHFQPLVGMSSGGTPCPVERSGIDVPEDERLYGELRFLFRCPAGAPVTVDYRVFFDIDPGHVGMLEVESPGGKARAELIREKPRWELNAAEGAPPQLRALDGAPAAPAARRHPAVEASPIAAAGPAERTGEVEPLARPNPSPPPTLEQAPGAKRRSSSYWIPAALLAVILVAGAALHATRRRRSPSPR